MSFVGINILGTSAVVSGARVSEMPAATAVSPHLHDLAFLMYADPEMVDVMLKLEANKYRAMDAGRTEYLAKLKHALTALETAALDLGEKHAWKKRAVEDKKYDEAAQFKREIDGDREIAYKRFRVRFAPVQWFFLTEMYVHTIRTCVGM